VFGDTVVLTYRLDAQQPDGVGRAAPGWKATRVYHRFPDGWRTVHAHSAVFSGTSPRQVSFAATPADFGRLEDLTLRDLLALEDAAMERWRQGDPLGFWEHSAPEVSYFDPRTEGRIDGSGALRRLYESIAGKYHYRVSQYFTPRVQVFGDTAVLTFQYRSADINEDGYETTGSHWNTTEVYQRIDGRWRIVHTHWSYTATPLPVRSDPPRVFAYRRMPKHAEIPDWESLVCPGWCRHHRPALPPAPPS